MGPRKNQKLEYVYRFYEKGKLAKEFEIHIAMGKWRRKSQMVRPLSHNSRHRHWIYSFYVLVMYVNPYSNNGFSSIWLRVVRVQKIC